MADLTIIAGECGRGSCRHDTGLFALPQVSGCGVERALTPPEEAN